MSQRQKSIIWRRQSGDTLSHQPVGFQMEKLGHTGSYFCISAIGNNASYIWLYHPTTKKRVKSHGCRVPTMARPRCSGVYEISRLHVPRTGARWQPIVSVIIFSQKNLPEFDKNLGNPSYSQDVLEISLDMSLNLPCNSLQSINIRQPWGH